MSYKIIKKEATIESCYIKQVFCKKVFLNVAALHIWKKALGNKCEGLHFSAVQASYQQLYSKMNSFKSIFNLFDSKY